MKYIQFTLAIISALLLNQEVFSQYYNLGNFGTNLVITSEHLGYQYVNYSIGSHGYGYRLYKIIKWDESILVKEKSGDFGCYSLNEIFFINDSIGFLAENCQGITELYKTTNFGTSWTLSGGGASQASKIFFLDALTGYFSFHPGGSNASYINGYGNGASWSSTDWALDGKYLYFLNDSIGFVSALDSLQNNCILQTSNFGESWSASYCDPYISPNDIKFFNVNIGLLVAQSGILFRTEDGGAEWTNINLSVTEDLNNIGIINQDESIIVGNNGTILKSIDKGETWVEESNNINGDLIRVTPIDGRIFMLDNNDNLYSDIAYRLEENQGSMQLLLFPNPVNTHLNIKGLEGRNNLIKIYTSYGQLLLESKSTSDIPVAHLSKGVYFLKVVTPDGSFILHRFIKK